MEHLHVASQRSRLAIAVVLALVLGALVFTAPGRASAAASGQWVGTVGVTLTRTAVHPNHQGHGPDLTYEVTDQTVNSVTFSAGHHTVFGALLECTEDSSTVMTSHEGGSILVGLQDPVTLQVQAQLDGYETLTTQVFTGPPESCLNSVVETPNTFQVTVRNTNVTLIDVDQEAVSGSVVLVDTSNEGDSTFEKIEYAVHRDCTGFDADGDGVSDCDELDAGTDPSVPEGDKIYWSREDGSNSIRYGPLTGDLTSGTGDDAKTLFDDSAPCGIAIDPQAGKIYWTNWSGGGVRVANLDGTGTPSSLFPPGTEDNQDNLCGVAVDPVAGKIYWADFTADTIRVGNLDGSGNPSTLFSEPTDPKSAPSGVAIDPANNKIYWTNQFSDEVRGGNLDGSGTAQTLFSGEDNPIGVAVDPAGGKIYWTDLNSGAVRVGPIGGSAMGAAETLFESTTPSGPAIDPTTNKIYWTSWQSGAGIRVGNLDGSGNAQTLFSGESASLFAALLKSPVGTVAPAISEGAGELSCSQGEWASDLLGAFLYRAPQSFAYQWLKDGTELTDEIDSTLTPTPTEPGAYTCEVTASNHVGSTSQTSDAFTVSAQATLHIDKFYDANANGQLDGGEIAIPNWRFQVGDTSYLTPQSLTGNPGDYIVTESNPVQTNWLHTTAGSVPVSLDAGEEATVTFGNLCLGGGGAQASGFWSNKNGQALFGTDDLASMVNLNLREANGSAFDPANYNAFKSWLQKATATNMANKLSAELATMELNVLNSKVNGNSLIYAPGTASANALGFATVNNVKMEANTELGLHGLTKSGSPFRSYQTALKDALEKSNSNLSFVQQSPCAFSFPPIP